MGWRRFVIVALVVAAVLLGCSKKQETRALAASTVASAVQPRRPAVAGSFYPAETDQLKSTVEGFLSRARPEVAAIAEDEHVVEILVPHAGYVFSGLTAAYGFAAVEGREYDTVVLIGPPHTKAVQGAAVFCGPSFETPLGTVPVDVALARAIVDSSPATHEDAAAHSAEHSIEVELPFVVSVLESVRIVAILVMGNRETLDEVARAVTEGIRKVDPAFSRTLIVISSDLAHYPSDEQAEANDSKMLDAFCSLDPDVLLAKDREIMSLGISGMQCTMCGLDAAYVGLRVARAAGGTAARLLKSCTSAEAGVSGATAERVVGYGSVVVTRPLDAADAVPTKPEIPRLAPLSTSEEEFLLGIARRSIEEFLKTQKVASFASPPGCPHLQESRGCFVTLYTHTAAEGGAGDLQLRGCIGTHVARIPLIELVPQMALAGAFEDPRFRRLRAAELPRVTIEISVYRTGVVPIRSADEFVPGQQGIILRVGNAEATFLPQVASEQEWDRVATLEHLCIKAGLPRDAWKRDDAQFFVYETQSFSE